MAGVYRQPISSLRPDAQNTLVIGVIINSKNPRNFNYQDKNRSGQRSVWTFTLRDSVANTINVTVWGTPDYINKLSAEFRIGSVVDVINAKVQERKPGDKNESFMPSVSSLCSLIVNEGVSLIQNHDGSDRNEYENLLSVPTKNVSGVRSLQYIMENMEALIDQYFDIIVVVTFVGESKNIMTRDGRSMVTRDFEVTDDSYPSTVALKFWENDWVQRSGDWEPKRTVLFIADIQVAFDRFKKKNTIVITRKTLITENPNTPKAEVVRNSIKTESEYMPSDPFVVPRTETIRNIMTIKEITQRLNANIMRDSERVQFVTVLFAQVTEMSLDDVNTQVLVTRCALCKRLVAGPDESCMNLNCACGNGRRPVQNILNFYIKVNLKDETGYLVGCRLSGEVAEKTLSCTPDEFKAMTFEQRSALNWKFKLEQVEAKLQVIGPSANFPRSLYNILFLKRIRDDINSQENFDDDTADVNS
ncbi:meiosis-specific with OB domain-containing protein [Microplitis demolitor]|uniref:meiosis-specific with OB domain-containing protein n=1 Tax=Microplitis demolitor TaxID=69319 RepID=UPI0004CD37D4|nr:meiosis-specific with OB domain-containing protein [Microplitis demolitor]